jgi:hypothetical protein
MSQIFGPTVCFFIEQVQLYVTFADTSYSYVYREVNAISTVENGAAILKRKSGEEFCYLIVC